MELDVILFYAAGQSSCGVGSDDSVILDALRKAELNARSMDLADVRLTPDGCLEARCGRDAPFEAWREVHAALMYHGAIAPPDAMDLLAALEARGTVVINGARAWPVFTDKLLFAEHMAARGVNVIPWRAARTCEELREAVVALGGEAVVKLPVSTEGEGVFVVRDVGDLDSFTHLMRHPDEPLLVQPIVDSRAIDLEPGVRALLLPQEHGRPHEFRINTARMPDGSIDITACYLRIAPRRDQVVNNVAQGARPIRVDFDAIHPADRDTVLAAARCAPPTGDLIGWDLIGRPGDRMIIEGNSGSGLPDGSEGIDPHTVVPAYAAVMRAAAERASIPALHAHGAG